MHLLQDLVIVVVVTVPCTCEHLIHASVSSTAILPCQHGIATDLVSAVHWYRSSSVSSDTYVNGNNPVASLNGNHPPGPYTFLDDFSLQIADVGRDDDRIYRCIVTPDGFMDDSIHDVHLIVDDVIPGSAVETTPELREIIADTTTFDKALDKSSSISGTTATINLHESSQNVYSSMDDMDRLERKIDWLLTIVSIALAIYVIKMLTRNRTAIYTGLTSIKILIVSPNEAKESNSVKPPEQNGFLTSHREQPSMNGHIKTDNIV